MSGTRIVRVEATSTTVHEADLEELKRLYPERWAEAQGNERAFALDAWLRELDAPWDELQGEICEPEVLIRTEPEPADGPARL